MFDLRMNEFACIRRIVLKLFVLTSGKVQCSLNVLITWRKELNVGNKWENCGMSKRQSDNSVNVWIVWSM